MLAISAYWISTALLCALYLLSAYLYAFRGEWARQGLVELGYPTYLAPFLLATKLLAVAAILLRVDVALSDLAYAGIFYHLVLSGLAYVGIAKPRAALPAAIGLVLVAISFLTQNAVREPVSPHAISAIGR